MFSEDGTEQRVEEDGDGEEVRTGKEDVVGDDEAAAIREHVKVALQNIPLSSKSGISSDKVIEQCFLTFFKLAEHYFGKKYLAAHTSIKTYQKDEKGTVFTYFLF